VTEGACGRPELDHVLIAVADLAAAAGEIEARHGLTFGRPLQWRSAGIEHAAAEPCLPFFIEWGAGTPLPGRAAAKHRAGDVSIARLELTGEADRLAAWLDGHTLPVAVHPGAPAVARVVLSGAAGAISACADTRRAD
jgi:hypothetical protein